MILQVIPGVIALHTLVAAAGGMPTVNISTTCRESEKAITALFGDTTVATYDNCMRQEQSAQQQLIKDWATCSRCGSGTMRPRYRALPRTAPWF